MANNTFSKRLMDLRTQKGIKREDIAKLLNCSVSAISNYENGNRTPDFDSLILLADYFDTTTDYLLGRTDIESSDISIQKICDFVHLSEEAVYILNLGKNLDETMNNPNLHNKIMQYKKIQNMSIETFFNFTLNNFIDFIIDNDFVSDIVEPIKQYRNTYNLSVSELKGIFQSIIKELDKTTYDKHRELFEKSCDKVYNIQNNIENADRYLYRLTLTIYEIVKKYASDSVTEYKSNIKIIDDFLDNFATTLEGGWTNEQINKFIDSMNLGGEETSKNW